MRKNVFVGFSLIVIMGVVILISLAYFNRTINILSEDNLPKIDNLDFELEKALNTMELLGEERMRKKRELYIAYSELDKGLDTWHKIETLERETDILDQKYWDARENWLRLKTIQGLSQGIRFHSIIISFYSTGYAIPRDRDLTSVLEEDAMTLKNIEERIAMKKSRLKELIDQKEIDEVERERDELRKLQSDYEQRKERYIQLKLLQEFTE